MWSRLQVNSQWKQIRKVAYGTDSKSDEEVCVKKCCEFTEELPNLQVRWKASQTVSFFYDPLAQWVEHLTFNQGVVGSSPMWVTIWHHRLVGLGHSPFKAGTRVQISLMLPFMHEWWNRQTRYFEVVVEEISCGFKSHLVHHICRSGGIGRHPRLKILCEIK